MTSVATISPVVAERSFLQGVRQILRFNWPQYVTATIVLLCASSIAMLSSSIWLKAICIAGVAFGAFWLIASLVVSYLVYDRSMLCRWEWIESLLDRQPRSWINIHAGLDESTAALRRMFPGATGRVFDIFDPLEMTEPSIARARRVCPAEEGESVSFCDLPVRSASVDVAFLLFSAHELRRPASRIKLFNELHRALCPGGRVIVVEHLRSVANALAFGPGAAHFYSRRQWLTATVGLELAREFNVTPFVTVFLFRRPR